MAQNSFRKDAYCGLYCAACPHYRATEDGTLEQFAAQKKSTPAEMRCQGCKSGAATKWCTECGLKKCAQSKGLEFCGDCESYPCADLQGFINDAEYPYHILVPQNLATIREQGVNVWLSEQDQRWRCPNCGTAHTWYDTTCPKCGSATRNWAS